jgi:hypothetical protein
MATHQDTTLTDTDTTNPVNPDSETGLAVAIAMQGTSISYNVGVFLQVGEQPGKDTNQAFGNLISYGDFLGFKNPQITVQGVIDLGEYDDETGASPSNVMTVKLLQEIYQSGHVFTLSDVYDSSTTTPIYRIHSLAGTFPSNTISTINVMCTGVTIDSNTQIKEGQKVAYSITFTEVRT